MTRTQAAVQAVKQASGFLKKSFTTISRWDVKPDGSFVSDADRGAEKIIFSIFKKYFPKDGILSEESPEQKGSSGFRWIIDPLDGTHNFLAGLPIFGCFIALEKNGEINFGICDFPMFHEFLVAEKNKGATCNGKKIHVSKSRAVDGQCFFSDGNLRRIPDKILSDLRTFSSIGLRPRIFGSSPFGFTRVALGHAVAATCRLTKPWDIAAPSLIVEEAGGRVTDSLDKPWSLTSDTLIASNGILHKDILKNFRI